MVLSILGSLVVSCLELPHLAVSLPAAAPGQSYEVLHDFTLDGMNPLSAVIQATDGHFYGTTNTGGALGLGTIFTMDSAGNLTTLHSFAGSPTEGNGPIGGLIEAIDGSLYGTTSGGGVSGSGTVFRIDASGELTTLHSFDGRDGSSPAAPLIQATDGGIYGTTTNGGAFGFGAVFKMDSAGSLTTVHSFAGPPAEGAYPGAGLIQGVDGNLYGTTRGGGTGGCAGGCGTAFRMDSSGSLTTLHSFAGPPGEGSDPIYAGLVEARDGNLYGTTTGGGNFGQGTVFRMNPSGNLTTLHSFGGAPSDGLFPYAGLIQGTDGSFYGTTTFGGTREFGTVFKVDSSGNLTLLHSFDLLFGSAGALIQATDGLFYGTTPSGSGNSYNGTVFKMNSVGDLATLHSFGYVEGANPRAELIQATDGDFYGTTTFGGAHNSGVVFKIDSSGNFRTLHSFAGPLLDGVGPYASLIQANDGNFYGTTTTGGAGNYGTVFKMDSAGSLTTLHSFGYFDGANPQASLIQATDGNLYGLTSRGGASDAGTVFRMDSSGNLITLHSFVGSDGSAPLGGLLQASDGRFYGTTSGGGGGCVGGCGTIFVMDSFGNLTTLHSFDGSDGNAPLGRLIQAKDGNLYGTTSKGGALQLGTVFKTDAAGIVTILHSFAGTPRDGSLPYAGLIQAADGYFYGTTTIDLTNREGTVFRMDSSGNLETYYSFAGVNGASPAASLIQATDGNLYGTTFSGGYAGGGVVFRLAPSRGLPPRAPRRPPTRLVPLRPTNLATGLTS